MNYVGYVNELFRNKLAETRNVVSFGQNISLASCLGGLTRGLPTDNGNLVINTTNSEYTLTGAGFGLMTEGVNGIFFLKQQDFLLLGIDHLVHTWNALRTRGLQTSFTIVAIVVDNGFEGPQSCINNLPDFCSISRIPGFAVSNRVNADAVIDKYLVAPGVRLIGVSQNMFRDDISEPITDCKLLDAENLIHQHGEGEDATIVSLNFAYTEASRLMGVLNERGASASLFNSAAVAPHSWDVVVEHASRTKNVLICDDSKSQHKASVDLAHLLLSQIPDCEVSLQTRQHDDSWSWPNPDNYRVADAEVLNCLAR
jgi:pyruvate/2-oxoglutarate/acetoin dehydrogenase E1 component